jgi:hypothetical protein
MSQQHDYQSVIGSGYAAPIATLLEHLSPLGANDVQTSVHESGYSASVIVLTVLMLESFLTLSKFLANVSEHNVRTYFRKTFRSSRYQDEFAELFVVRDVIAHNHVWAGSIDDVAMTWMTAKLGTDFGDNAFDAVVDLSSRTTRKLGLHVVPTRLGYEDVRTVMKTTALILQELSSMQPQVSGHAFGTGGFGYARYKGQHTTFLDLANSL